MIINQPQNKISIPLPSKEFEYAYAEIFVSLLREHYLDVLYTQINDNEIIAYIEADCSFYFLPKININRYRGKIMLTDSPFYEFFDQTEQTEIIDRRIFVSNSLDATYINIQRELIQKQIDQFKVDGVRVQSYVASNTQLFLDIAREFELNVLFIGRETIIYQGLKIDLNDAAMNILQGNLPRILISGNWSGSIKEKLDFWSQYYYIFDDHSVLVEIPCLIDRNNLISSLENGPTLLAKNSDSVAGIKIDSKFLLEEDDQLYIETNEGKITLSNCRRDRISADWENGSYLNKWGKFIYQKYNQITKYGLQFDSF